jgi:hypothetical protein
MNGAQRTSSTIHVYILFFFFVTFLGMLNKEYVNIKERTTFISSDAFFLFISKINKQ